MKIGQKKSKLIEDLVYQNGQLNCKLSQKNTKIAERIKELALYKMAAVNDKNEDAADLIEAEINWLKKLADI